MLLKLLAILFLVLSGLLVHPIFWLLLIFLLVKTGDSFTRILAPSTTTRLTTNSFSNISSSRQLIRIVYVIGLLIIGIYFLYKKLFLFAFLAGLLLLLQLLCNSSVFLFSFRRLFQGVALFLFFFGLLRTMGSGSGGRPSPLPVVKDDQDEQLIPDKPDSTGKTKNQFTLKWNDYLERQYVGTFGTASADYSRSENNRNSIEISNGVEDSYPPMYRFDKRLLTGIIPMFEKIKSEKKLDTKSFAEMAGSFVQRIPYLLVHDYSCRELLRMAYNDEFIQQYHRDGKQCLQNCKFGIQAPVEFTYNLKGDCDTRALFLFTLLDHFGYDVAVFTSNAYGHAILGIGLPYSRLYKSYGGVRYYTWELTAMGWQPGLLPPQVSDMNNWNIVMVNH